MLAAGRRAVGRARVDVVENEVRAESGHLRETGNLIFHISVVLVLVGVAVGALYGYRGSAIVTEGDGFSNSLTQYDDFGSGALFDPDDLPPFSMEVDAVDVRFQMSGPQRGAPRHFEARGVVAAEPTEDERALLDPREPPASDRRHVRVPRRPGVRTGLQDHRRRG